MIRNTSASLAHIVPNILISLSFLLLVGCGGGDPTSSPPPSTSTDGLVINEIDYDTTNIDTLEFIEIHNSSLASIDLTNVILELVNGSTDSVYHSYNLTGDVSSIASGGYLVFSNSAVTVAGGAIVIIIGNGSIQNGGTGGDGDGLRLVDTTGPTVVDGLAYEGSIAGTGEAGGELLVDDGIGSLSRCPNAHDTDDNNADFTFTTVVTPGADNSCI